MTYLGTIEAWEDARPYLENLKRTIIADVKPLLDLTGAAPFAISREVVCYIDHLGHLYSGNRKTQTRFQAYLTQVMCRIDPNYKNRWQEIHEMYRHGPVHQFTPKTLKNTKGQLLGWLCYAGVRNDYNFIDLELNLIVTHLKLVGNPTNNEVFYLPVSSVCLIDDLIGSIDEFQKIGPKDERSAAWNRAACELTRPKIFKFVVQGDTP